MPPLDTAATSDDQDLDPNATTEGGADPEADPADADDAQDGTDDGEADGVQVQIGDEPPAGSEEGEEQDDTEAKPWVKELRVRQRELARENRELKARLQVTATPAAEQPAPIGDEPTLESCDYDAGKFRDELLAWTKRRSDAEAAQRKREQDARTASDAWQATLDSHAKAAKALKVKDYQEAEEAFKDATTPLQQTIVVNGAGNSALVVYALGKNPAKLKELGSITDPVKFAFAVAKLETQVKVTPRKQTPAPEGRVRGSAPGVGAVDNQLARLEKEADRTGDRTKVIAYKREKREKATTRA